jgi:hypothetical protein
MPLDIYSEHLGIIVKGPLKFDHRVFIAHTNNNLLIIFESNAFAMFLYFSNLTFLVIKSFQNRY